jgi:hypothetical protein
MLNKVAGALDDLQIDHPRLDSLIGNLSGIPRIGSTLHSPFDKVPNELLLRIITIAAEEDPPDYKGPGDESGPTLGPYSASASRVCRLWFNLTRMSNATSHLWHYAVRLDWSAPEGDRLPAFQQKLIQSRGCNIYISFSCGPLANSLPLFHLAAASLQILCRYRHQIASMAFWRGTHAFTAPYLPNFTAGCEHLHTIVTDGITSFHNHDGNLADLYRWQGSLTPFWS